MFRRRVRLANAVLVLLLATSLTDCSRWRHHDTSSLPPTASGTTSQATVTLTSGTAPSAINLGPITNDLTASVQLTAPTASGSLTATLSATNPTTTALASVKRAPASIGAASLMACEYVSLNPGSTAQSFPDGTSMTFSTSNCVNTGNGVYVAEFDENNASAGWNEIVGPVTPANAQAVFSDIGALSLPASDTIVLVAFVADSSYSPTQTSSCDASARMVRGFRRAATVAKGSDVVPNRLFVTYKSASAAPSAAARAVSNVGYRFGAGLHHALTFKTAADAASAMTALQSDPSVASVSAVHKRFAASDSVANDFLMDNTDEWYNYRTNVDTGVLSSSAWNVSQGSAAVKIAIIDTGFDETNTDINSKIDYKESDVGGVTTTGNGSVQDTQGHGTNVAGLAVAQVNNESAPASGFDSTAYAGVGYNVHMLAFKIFPDSTASCEEPSADTADEIKAIDDAVSNGASVISMSLGGSSSDSGEQTAVEAAINAGVVVVAANGNEYDTTGDGTTSDYPAGYAGVIAVGASAVTNTTANDYASITGDTAASYSNSGPTLLAPGGDAQSDTDPDTLHWIEGYDTTTGGDANLQCATTFPTTAHEVCAVLFNGTSQATPQVSGTVGLMLSAHGGSMSMTPAAVKQMLISTASPISGVAAARQGAGLLNAYAAVSAAKI